MSSLYEVESHCRQVSKTTNMILTFKILILLVLFLVFKDHLKLKSQDGNKPNMQALMATLENVCDTNWYPNLGASNHVTANANNLVEHTTYHGNEQVHVGNGMRLTIKHIVFHNFSSLPFHFSVFVFKSSFSYS